MDRGNDKGSIYMPHHTLCAGCVKVFSYNKGGKVLGQLKYVTQYVTDPELRIHMAISIIPSIYGIETGNKVKK